MWKLSLTVLFLMFATVASAADVTVETLSGETVTGELTSWTADAIVIEVSGRERRFSAQDIIGLAPAANDAAVEDTTIWISTADGSKLSATEYTVADGEATIQLVGGATWKIPARSLTSIRFRPQSDELAKQWDQIRSLNVSGDLLVIRKNDALDHLEGVLKNVTGDKVEFSLDSDVIPVARSKVEGLIYFRAAPPQLGELGSVVHLAGNQQLQAQEIHLQDDMLHVRTRLGESLSVPLGALRRVDYSAGKIVYLSDLEVDSAKWTPYFATPAGVASLEQSGRPRFDQSMEGGPLRLGNKEYNKGIALRSRSEVVYRLPDAFRKFTALAGIDDRVGQAGHVRLVIRGDDKELLNTELAGGDDPLPIDVDLTGVRRLTILVDYGKDLDVADFLDLCNARISK